MDYFHVLFLFNTLQVDIFIGEICICYIVSWFINMEGFSFQAMVLVEGIFATLLTVYQMC